MADTNFCTRCGNSLSNHDIFCCNCGTRKRQLVDSIALQSLSSEKDIITNYFLAGYQYKSIVLALKQYHEITMSVRTLKRRLLTYDLKRKNVQVPESTVRQIIQCEIQGPSAQQGYRGMWHTLKTSYGISYPRDAVMKIIREVDPEGTKIRRARRLHRRKYISAGPNFCWHIDGHDKLKPYGFPIHGCVDGFSRRVIWLRVSRTNNNPIVPAYSVFKCIERTENMS